MKVVLLRHGKTVGNMYGAYVGKSDQPLCEEGKAELQQRKIKAFYPVVDAVFTSPMLRCTQTAKLIYPELSATIVEELQERDFGRFEDLSHKEIIKIPGFERWGMTQQNMEFPDGEEWDNFAQRSCKGFMTAVGLAAKRASKSAAVVCHGGTIMAIMEAYIQPPKSRYEWQCVPGSGFLLKLDARAKSISVVRRLLT